MTAGVIVTVMIVPPNRRPFVERGLLWMARFGALLLTPEDA